MKEILIKTCQRSTIHSIPKIVLSKFILVKITWILATVFSITLCSCTIVNLINDYLNYDVVTRVRISNEKVSEFPSVTLCNTNALVSNETDKLVNELMPLLKDQNDKVKDILLLHLSMSKINDEFTKEQKQALSYSINETLLRCRFQASECKAVSWYFDRTYGNCIKFNSGFNIEEQNIPILTTRTGGERSGLIVLYFLGYSNLNDNVPLAKGLLVKIDKSSNLVYLDDALTIPANAVTSIAIKRTVIKKLGPPFGDCMPDLTKSESYLYKYITNKMKTTYKQRDCFDLIKQQLFIKECNCTSYLYEKLDENIKNCRSVEEINCTITTLANSDAEIEKKAYLCPLECKTIIYNPTISFLSPFKPSLVNDFKLESVLMSKFPKNVTDQEVANSFASVKVYYYDTSYTEITESAKFTFLNLISNIGGTLGLFLGMSILSIVEVFEFFLEILLVYLSSNVVNTSIDH
jgi:hypothetical protein